jgi:radical SAM protein (TIGR01212 family)
MKPYNDYNTYLRSKYGEKVYRIGIDAGFSCPNRDGTKGTGGCIYCDEQGSRSPYANKGYSVAEQLLERIEYLKAAKSANKFIAYFQAFTNTYAPADRLKEIYDEILPFDGIVGMSIGTRPDCFDDEKARLIASYIDVGAVREPPLQEVWVEFGLQSIHDKTLKLLNRGHTYGEFITAVEIAKTFNIPVCAHVILGLPGETKDDMMETARRLGGLGIKGIKIHLFHILKGTPLEKMFNEGNIKIPSQDQYAELACDFLEHLPKSVIIQRLTGQGSPKTHVAPAWAFDKLGTIALIEKKFMERGTRQGSTATKN